MTLYYIDQPIFKQSPIITNKFGRSVIIEFDCALVEDNVSTFLLPCCEFCSETERNNMSFGDDVATYLLLMKT